MNIIENRTEEKYELIYQPKGSTNSGNILKIIPSDPGYEPSIEQQYQTIKYLATVFPRNEIRSELTRKVQFIDPGENFETVKCNSCGEQIEIEFWQEAMGNAYKSEFENLNFLTHCCHSETSLNDLVYEMPAGFSKYKVIINDPDIADSQSTTLLKDLYDMLRQDIKFIWARY